MIERCPLCGGNMEHPKVQTGTVAVTIDKCSNCKGIWLDPGELEQILGIYERGRKLFKRNPISAYIKANRLAKSALEVVK